MRTYQRDRLTSERRTVLSFDELIEADTVAALRGKQGRHLLGFGSKSAERRGARCELAAAKILGVPWNVPYSTDFKRIHARADVGPYEIRSIGRPGGRLIVRKKDRDDAIFILALEEHVRVMAGHATAKVTLLGWKFGGDAKQEKWLDQYGTAPAAWFVPQHWLEPMDTLPRRNGHGS